MVRPMAQELTIVFRILRFSVGCPPRPVSYLITRYPIGFHELFCAVLDFNVVEFHPMVQYILSIRAVPRKTDQLVYPPTGGCAAHCMGVKRRDLARHTTATIGEVPSDKMESKHIAGLTVLGHCPINGPGRHSLARLNIDGWLTPDGRCVQRADQIGGERRPLRFIRRALRFGFLFFLGFIVHTTTELSANGKNDPGVASIIYRNFS